MNIQEEFEKINISHAIKAKPASSLIEILRSLNIEDLLSITSEGGIKSRFNATKEMIIKRFLRHILDRKRIECALVITESDEYDLFLKLLNKEYIQDNTLAYGTYGYLMDKGIIYSFYDDYRVFFTIPNEIKEVCKIIDNIYLDRTLKKNQLVYKYILAFINLYGVFKVEKLVEIFNCQNNEKLTIEEFTAIFNKYSSRQQPFYDYNEYIINHYFDDENFCELELLLEKTANVSYYIPDRRNILKYADSSYFEMTAQIIALKDFIIKNMCSNEELAGYVVDDTELLCSMEEPMQSIIYEFERRHIFFKSMEQFNSIVSFIEDVYKNVRTWSNRGYTYTEICKITGKPIPKIFNEPVEVLINNKPATLKIGRNDSCPCGSGKKYKKCCGR